MQARIADEPVLLVAYDIVSKGPLAEVVPSEAAFGMALVLAPARAGIELPTLTLRADAGAKPTALALPQAFAALAAANPMAASALPFATALVSDAAPVLVLPFGVRGGLVVELG